MNISLFLSFVKQHKLFSFSIGILLIGFIVVIFLIIGSLRTSETKPPSENTRSSTPPSSLVVVSVHPENNTLINKIYPEITATFSKPITTFERSNISIASSPDITGETSWSVDQKTLFFTPTTPLFSSTTYTLAVKYGSSELYRWILSTVSADTISIEDQTRAQTEADKRVADIQEEILKNYPWYNQLPLHTDSYFVYFDVDKKKFIGQLYSSNNQFDSLKNEAISKLQSIGVNTSAFTFEWTENTVSPTPLPD